MQIKTSKADYSILGCGWLGLALAKHLSKNNKIKGSSTNIEEIKDNNFDTYHINLQPNINDSYDKDFFNSKNLIICFPPKRRDDIIDFLSKQIKSLIKAINTSPIENILFISSTSVYPNTNKEIFEKDEALAEKDSGKALLIAENLLKAEKHLTLNIVRFGGLIGYDRLPGRFLAGKKQVKDAEAPVNLIHRDDCIRIIESIFDNNIQNETFNACSPLHPTRKEFYQAAAKKEGFTPPEFDNNEASFKIINCDKLINAIDYKFIYKSPLDCL